MSSRFNFDDFDRQIGEALQENELAMRPIIRRHGGGDTIDMRPHHLRVAPLGSVALSGAEKPTE